MSKHQHGNKHHETKTNIHQHSGSSLRVPIDGGVRSASSELGLYRSDHDFSLSGTGNSTQPQKINKRGDIVGIYIDSLGVERGFVRFSDGSFSAPIVDPNDTVGFTHGRGINNSRTVCGEYIGSDGNDHSYFLSGGTFTEYNVPGAIGTDVLGINDVADFAGGFDPDGSGIFRRSSALAEP